MAAEESKQQTKEIDTRKPKKKQQDELAEQETVIKAKKEKVIVDPGKFNESYPQVLYAHNGKQI